MELARPTQQEHRPHRQCIATGEFLWFSDIPVHADLSLRHDKHVDDLVGELQRLNINVLGHLVDLVLGDVTLNFGCVDDVLDVRVHALLRLSLRLNDKHLKDLPNEKN